MNKFCFFFLFLFSAQISFSSTPIQAIANGNRNQIATWNLNLFPLFGGTILIPATKSALVTDDPIIKGLAYTKRYRKLSFQNNNSTLQLGSSSRIYVFNLKENNIIHITEGQNLNIARQVIL